MKHDSNNLQLAIGSERCIINHLQKNLIKKIQKNLKTLPLLAPVFEIGLF